MSRPSFSEKLKPIWVQLSTPRKQAKAKGMAWYWRLLGWPLRRVLSFGRFYFRHKIKLSLMILALGIWYWNCLPSNFFYAPTATVLEDQNGNLLGARIADDGQWRFPATDSVPLKFRAAIIEFEDHRFEDHHGISFAAMARAMRQNVENGKVVSGGSTITMQVIRIMRQGQKRTYAEKLIEVIWATRLEFSYSKDEILAMYASYAPFGGNVVGIDAASWRYFGRGPHDLSWAESSMLAVLPNAPSLIHPGKNRDLLIAKRNRLLDRLHEAGHLDETSLQLAKEEPLPEKPYPLPQMAPHLLDRLIANGQKGQRVRSTIDYALQNHAMHLVERHRQRLAPNEIHNAAVLILDVNTAEVLAYVGNTSEAKSEHNNMVDVIPAARSTGSILKPFLYASMLDDGSLTPDMLVADVPTHLGGYVPKNYHNTYDGAVPASRALARSLNVPAVRMLQEYGVGRFQRKLKKLGLKTLHRPAEDYGLTLILGGAEASLWDLAGVYANMGRTLNAFPQMASYQEPTYILNEGDEKDDTPQEVLSAGAIWHTFESMIKVARPEGEVSWDQFSTQGRIAWKTGTSFGFRDAWAIGINQKYVVAVWVGNADGEGRPGLVGSKAAAPLLFDLFDPLQQDQWFDKPWDDLAEAAVCRQSGHRASGFCTTVDTAFIPIPALRTTACPYHREVHLDLAGEHRVDLGCADINEMKTEVAFVLPPAMEWYYQQRHPDYVSLPPMREECDQSVRNPMSLLYPKKFSEIHVPVEVDGKLGRTIFEATHSDRRSEIHWHLDETYLGSTNVIHQMELAPEPGEHILTIVDASGHSISCPFSIAETD